MSYHPFSELFTKEKVICYTYLTVLNQGVKCNLEPNQNPNENKKTLPITEYLTPTNLSLGSLALGVLTLILIFFPDTKVLTIILGIIALLLGVYSYYTTNGILISIIGIITSTIPLLFFSYLKLTWIYFEAERPFFF
jgi:hypothetical protein